MFDLIDHLTDDWAPKRKSPSSKGWNKEIQYLEGNSHTSVLRHADILLFHPNIELLCSITPIRCIHTAFCRSITRWLIHQASFYTNKIHYPPDVSMLGAPNASGEQQWAHPPRSFSFPYRPPLPPTAPPPPSSSPLSMYRCVAVLSVSPNCRPSCVRYATMPTSTDHSDTIDACDIELLEICDFDVNCQILFDPVGKVSGGGQINPNWFIFSPPWLVSFSRSIK